MVKINNLTEKAFNNAVVGTQARFTGHFSEQEGEARLFSNYVSFQQSTKGNLAMIAYKWDGDLYKLLPAKIKFFFDDLLSKYSNS